MYLLFPRKCHSCLRINSCQNMANLHLEVNVHLICRWLILVFLVSNMKHFSQPKLGRERYDYGYDVMLLGCRHSA